MSLGSPDLDAAYDRWKTTPPEEPDSILHCHECKCDIYPGERIYRLDDEVYCSECAKEWLAQFEEEATEEQCYGKH